MYCTCSLGLSRSDRVRIVRSRLRDPNISVCSVLYQYAGNSRDDLLPEAEVLLSPLLPRVPHVGLQHSATGEEKGEESDRRAPLVSPLLFTGFHGKPCLFPPLAFLFLCYPRAGLLLIASDDFALEDEWSYDASTGTSSRPLHGIERFWNFAQIHLAGVCDMVSHFPVEPVYEMRNDGSASGCSCGRSLCCSIVA